ncbi:MAG: hypothetical protein M3Q44_04315 [bacterium]|nr:hypothetical protein [bacterium]
MDLNNKVAIISVAMTSLLLAACTTPQVPAPSPSSESLQPTSISIDTQPDWLVYSDTENGYTFQYPEKLDSVSYGQLSNYNEGDYKGKSLVYSKNTSSTLNNGLKVTTLALKNTTQTAKQFADIQFEKEQADPNAPQNKGVTQTNVNNKNAAYFIVDGFGLAKVYFIQNGGIVIRISGLAQGSDEEKSAYMDSFDQIVKTLQFK